MAHLVNPLATPAQLFQRASLWSLPQDLQEVVYMAAQCLTQAAGMLLELPQSVTAQACVILGRYWLVESPMAHEFSDASAAALYLVAKMGPMPRSTRDVSNVYAYLVSSPTLLGPRSQAADDRPERFYQSESDYAAFQGRLLALESRILRAVGFDTHVALPHALAVTYLQALDFLGRPSQRREVSLRTVQHLNAGLVSPQLLYLTHQPQALATAAVYCAARDLGAKMPESAWWEVFDVDREELGFLVVGLRSVEGILARSMADTAWAGGGMVTRAAVREELRRRGAATAAVGNGDDGAAQERETMRIMDSR